MTANKQDRKHARHDTNKTSIKHGKKEPRHETDTTRNLQDKK